MRQLLTKVVGASLALYASSLMAQQIATYKGGDLTVDEFKSAIEALGPQGQMLKSNEQLQKQYLQHLIDMKLIADKAKAAKVEESEQYKTIMAATQREVLAKIYIDQYLAEQTSPEKLKKYFNENKKDFTAKEVQVAHILFDKEDKATGEKVLKEAKKKNADFSALIAEHATDPTGAQGGELDFFGPGSVVPAFEEAAFATPKGQVHPKLVETDFGWHIIKVNDVRGGDKVKFEERQEQVAEAVRNQASEAMVQQLRDQAQVQISEEVLRAVNL